MERLRQNQEKSWLNLVLLELNSEGVKRFHLWMTPFHYLISSAVTHFSLRYIVVIYGIV